jgi:hypothetical protein
MDLEKAIGKLDELTFGRHTHQTTVETNDLLDLKMMLRETRRHLENVERKLRLAYDDRLYADKRMQSVIDDLRLTLSEYACDCEEQCLFSESKVCGGLARSALGG